MIDNIEGFLKAIIEKSTMKMSVGDSNFTKCQQILASNFEDDFFVQNVERNVNKELVFLVVTQFLKS